MKKIEGIKDSMDFYKHLPIVDEPDENFISAIDEP